MVFVNAGWQPLSGHDCMVILSAMAKTAATARTKMTWKFIFLLKYVSV